MNESYAYGAEHEAFATSAGRLLDRFWPDATAAGRGETAALVAAGSRQGWFELGAERAARFLVALTRELGARGCPVPVGDAYVAQVLFPELAPALASAELRPVVRMGREPDGVLVSGVARATHVLRLDPATTTASLHPVVRRREAEGLAAPSWERLSVGRSEHEVELDASRFEESIAVVRLAAAAHTASAVERAHRLAVEHAKTRRQFGRAIGAFGAVQQRTAACHIDVTANQALIEEAAQVLENGDSSAGVVAALAARHIADRAVDVLSGAQHTLGAVGYFDEHEVFWLFRGVHADLTLARELERQLPARLTLAGMLLAPDGGLPPLELGAAAERLRAQVREMLDRHRHDSVLDVEGLRSEMAEWGGFALGWPVAEGGHGAGLGEQVVLNEEMKYAGGPVDRAMSATMLIGHSLLRHGSEAQKASFLPLLRAGRLDFCLGYSESEAGSDLAALRTRATRDGDDWVIDGQKLWTTRAHTASHVWLAARTDPDVSSRHAGITIFLVPMDTPGITVQRHRALSGEISCTVFYDAVRVPDAARVGEVDAGWRVITDALAAERVVMGGVAATLLGHLDALLPSLRERADLDPVGRDRLASVAARLQAARVLVLAATRAMDGDEARTAGPMAAVLSGDLAEEFGRVALDLLGPAACVSESGLGRFEALLRLAPMYVIGGGTNDIQRGIIARSLGLPRE